MLDVGDKLVALPYDDLRVSADGDTFYIDRTEAQLKAAPAFTYEAQAEAQARAQRHAASAQPAPARTTAAPTKTDRPRTTAPRTATAAKSANVVLDVFDYRASDLIGATVLDDRGESVGKIDDIVVSTEDDKLHAVIAIGGFAGFGAKLISMPFEDLQITSDGDTPQVRIAMTGEQLEQLVASRPEFRYERQVAQAPARLRAVEWSSEWAGRGASRARPLALAALRRGARSHSRIARRPIPASSTFGISMGITGRPTRRAPASHASPSR